MRIEKYLFLRCRCRSSKKTINNHRQAGSSEDIKVFMLHWPFPKNENNVVFIFLPPSLAHECVGRSIECLLRCYCVALCYGYLLELNYKFSDWSFANIHFNLEKWDRTEQRALHATRKRFLKIASRMIWISLSSHDDVFRLYPTVLLLHVHH